MTLAPVPIAALGAYQINQENRNQQKQYPRMKVLGIHSKCWCLTEIETPTDVLCGSLQSTVGILLSLQNTSSGMHAQLYPDDSCSLATNAVTVLSCVGCRPHCFVPREKSHAAPRWSRR